MDQLYGFLKKCLTSTKFWNDDKLAFSLFFIFLALLFLKVEIKSSEIRKGYLVNWKKKESNYFKSRKNYPTYPLLKIIITKL